jgi:hypothetical protein
MKFFFLTSVPLFLYGHFQVQVLMWSLIGNAVKTGRARRCDPALDSLCLKEKGNSLSILRHCQEPPHRGADGKAVERAGESEDLPEQSIRDLRGLRVTAGS